MVKTNAQRQADYRKRLKEAAKADNLAKRVEEAIEAALRACWAIAVRGGLPGFQLPPHRSNKDHPVQQLEDLFALFADDATADEKVTIDRACAILEAATYRKIAAPE